MWNRPQNFICLPPANKWSGWKDNQTLKSTLLKFVRRQSKPLGCSQAVLFVYRTSKNDLTKFPPFETLSSAPFEKQYEHCEIDVFCHCLTPECWADMMQCKMCVNDWFHMIYGHLDNKPRDKWLCSRGVNPGGDEGDAFPSPPQFLEWGDEYPIIPPIF